MWLLNFIPDWILHLVALGSLSLLFISFLVSGLIPVQFRLPAQILGVALVVVSVWLEGGLYNQANWQDQIAAQKQEIARLDAASKEVTIKTVNKYI